MNGTPMIRRLPELLIEPVVRRALAEDLGRAGDLTSQACIPEGARMRQLLYRLTFGPSGVAISNLAIIGGLVLLYLRG